MPEFRELLTKLPDHVQRQARDAYRLWQADPFHPSLHFKSVSQRDPTLYSARIGGSHRVLGTRRGDSIV